MATSGVRRVARGSVAAALSTFVALLSHVAGGGTMPTATGVLVPLVLSITVCAVLAGRRLALPRLSAAVLASQGLFHTLFTIGTPSGITATSGSAHGVAHLHPVILTEAGTHGHASGPTMWWTHVLAAVVTVVAIRHGERAAGRLLGVLRVTVVRFAIGRLERARAIRPVRIRRAARSDVPVPLRRVLRLDPVVVRSRRGPPVALAV